MTVKHFMICERTLNFKAASGCVGHNTSVIYLKTNKGCVLSGKKEVGALVASYSVSSWVTKMDPFSLLELCLEAAVN